MESLAKTVAGPGESAFESFFGETPARGEIADGLPGEVFILQEEAVVFGQGREAFVENGEGIAVGAGNVRRFGMIQPLAEQIAAGLPAPPFIYVGTAGEPSHPPPQFISVIRVWYSPHSAEECEVRRFRRRLFITVAQCEEPAEESRIKSAVKFPPRRLIATPQRGGEGTQVFVHDGDGGRERRTSLRRSGCRERSRRRALGRRGAPGCRPGGFGQLVKDGVQHLERVL